MSNKLKTTMSIQFSRQGIDALPTSFPAAQSSFVLVRRLIEAKDDASVQTETQRGRLPLFDPALRQILVRELGRQREWGNNNDYSGHGTKARSRSRITIHAVVGADHAASKVAVETNQRLCRR